MSTTAPNPARSADLGTESFRAILLKIALNPWVQASAVGSVALAVYIRTLAPTVMWYDMGEFATAAYVLGIAHNTGYPLVMLLGKMFTFLPVGDIAYRVNLMSAFFGAMTVVFLYMIVYELTKRRLAAAIAALTLAFTSTLWSNATWATSYDLNAFLTLLILWLMLRWRRDYQNAYLYAAVLTFGLSLGNHRMIVGVGVSMAYLIWRAYREKKWVLGGKAVTIVGLLFLAGFAINLYLPLRAAQDPPVNWGNPSDLEGFLKMITTGSARAFINPFESITSLQSVAMVLTLFPIYEFTVVGLILAGLGALALWLKDRYFLVATLFVAAVAGLMVSVYGIHNIFNYLQPIYLMLAIWLGVGVKQLLVWAEDRIGEWTGDRLTLLTRPRRTLLTSALLLGLPLVLFSRNFNMIDRSQHRDAADFADYVLSKAEPGSVILADFWTWAPLLYAQVVEGKGPDVQVSPDLSLPGLNQQALVENLLDLEVPVYVVVGIENSPRLKLNRTDLQLVAPYSAHYYPTHTLPLPEFKDALVPMGMVYRAVAEPPDLTLPEVPQDDVLNQDFGSVLTLRGFNVESQSLSPGDIFKADYYWSVPAKTDTDYWVDVLFTNENGEVATRLGLPLWLHSHWIGSEAFATSNWPANQIMHERYDGIVPRSVQPGIYYIWAHIYEDPHRDKRVGTEGVLLGTITVIP